MFLERLSLLFLLLFALINLWGCPQDLNLVKDQEIRWNAPKSIFLYRGLRSGLSPLMVEKDICQKWSLGRCYRLKRHFRKGTNKGEYFYQYRGVYTPYPCVYWFTFQRWGLMKVSGECQLHDQKDVHSLMVRYRRWYGKPTNELKTSKMRGFSWVFKRNSIDVKLILQGLKVYFEHGDRERRWMRYLAEIQPQKNEITTKMWQLWIGHTKKIRRKVLFNFAHIIESLHEQLEHFPQTLLLSEQVWTPPLKGYSCQAYAVRAELWQKLPWRVLAYLPQSPRWLHYRLRFLTTNYRHFPKEITNRFSWIISRNREILIEAKGCGAIFTVRGVQSGKMLQFSSLTIKKED